MPPKQGAVNLNVYSKRFPAEDRKGLTVEIEEFHLGLHVHTVHSITAELLM
jgi:hypothetical protein